MKKTKLLLPVFSVGAIAAAVVPCVTSCSETSTLSYQPGDEKPEYEPMEESKSIYLIEEATNEYFNRVGKKLLAQEIILDNANDPLYSPYLSSVKVTTKLNKKYHTINFTSDWSSDSLNTTVHVECENVEFIATRLWGGAEKENIISPKILVYVKEAYEKLHNPTNWTPEEIKAAVKKALTLADDLSRDTSWSFLTEEYYEDLKETITTRINYANIYEYVDNIFKEPIIDLNPLLTLVNFSIKSNYLSSIKIDTGDN